MFSIINPGLKSEVKSLNKLLLLLLDFIIGESNEFFK